MVDGTRREQSVMDSVVRQKTSLKRQRVDESSIATTSSARTCKRKRCSSPPRLEVSHNNNILRDEDSTNNIPHPKATPTTTSPDDYLLQLVEYMIGHSVKSQAGLELKNFFPSITEEQVASYTMDVAASARKNEVSTLERLRSEEGLSLDCCNRFGETLLHIAARRGYTNMFEYLLQQPNVSVRVIDDTGRTPLHDALWNPTPQLDICKWIVQRDPSLFFITDKRGFTPFHYARTEHWDTWKTFLFDNRECFRRLATPKFCSKFS